MEGPDFLPLPDGLRITEICQGEIGLLIKVLSERMSACCPLCEQSSDVVHSRYQRSLKDLPCCGQQIGLQLTVRKFFCQNPQCQRKIFTERLATFVEPWAQMTRRLHQALQAIGLSTSASLGARLALRLGIATSWMTILRRVMELPPSEVGTVTELGIDDFSFKRGRKFGTILVDLSTHQVIDLLPERSAESAAAWMRDHPEIRYVSRDRGQDYATAGREGAPQAQAVADRFHIMKNFVEAIEPEVSRCYKHLRQAQLPLPRPSLPSPGEWRQASDAGVTDHRRARLVDKQEQFEQVKALLSQGLSALSVAERLTIPVRRVYHWKAREACPAGGVERPKRPNRLERYERVQELRRLGLSQQEIAERLAIGRRRVQRWQKRPGDDEINQPRRKRRSIFDPSAAYVLSRWQQGERCVSLLWQEIQAQGFRGSLPTMYRFVRTLRLESVPLPAPSVADRVSVQQALWLLVRPYKDLKDDERRDLREVCEASSELRALHHLAQSFGQIVRSRSGHQLQDWIKQIEARNFRSVKRFVAGLRRDENEVLAGLTLTYSNGQVEGFVNKLKLLKRQGYGRASFPLLRQRVLHALESFFSRFSLKGESSKLCFTKVV